MRTKKILMTVLIALFAVTTSTAKKKEGNTDWAKYDFMDEMKGKIKIPGKLKKSLKGNPSFVSDYCVSNALVMKGSESNAKGTVHSEVHLAGISNDAFQTMTNELYEEFATGLQHAGMTITDGEQLMQSDWALKKKDSKNNYVGKIGNDPMVDKAGIMDGAILGYGVFGVKEGISYRPEDKNVFFTSKKVFGNFYQNLVSQNDVNLISVNYYITFASFDGGRGYKSARLETQPVMSINPVVTIWGAKISFGKIPIWGDADWSLGIAETDLDKLEYFGLATSAEYAIKADPDKYIAEVKAIIQNFQDDLVAALKAEIN